ncbi:MAG TPA: ABC transporter permease [Polyangiaceae bacterium]|nr:ABC transporter permease [Polyangiaceae bacterium]
MKSRGSAGSPLAELRRGWREEWRQLWRERSLLIILVCLPVLYSATVYWLYRAESVVDCPVIVVDQDGGPQATRLTWLIDATEEARVLDRMSSIDDAFARLRRHEAAAVVLLPEGFGARLLRGEPARIKLWIDSANMLTYGTAYTGIRAAVSVLDDERTEAAYAGKGMPRRLAERRTTPIEISDRLLFHPTGSYGGFMAPGVFMVALQQAILLAYAMSAGNQRERAEREGDARRPTYLRRLGRLGVHLPFHWVSAALVAWMIRSLFPFPTSHGLGLFVLLALFVVVTGLLAILVSLPFTNGRTPMQVLVLVSAPLFLASGYTWPLGEMPAWVAWIARSVPTTPVLAGLRSIGMKSSALASIQEPLTSLAVLGAVYLLAGLAAVTTRRWLEDVRLAAAPAADALPATDAPPAADATPAAATP